MIMLCRSEERANAAINSINESVEDSDGTLTFEQCDMSSMLSVRKCAERMLEYVSKIDILVNNAGVAFQSSPVITEDGQELVMQVNHFGNFLLTNLVSGLLSRAKGGSRVVMVVGHA